MYVCPVELLCPSEVVKMLRRVTCFCKDYSVLCYISQLGDCLYVVYVLFFYKISLMLWWGLVTTATTEFDFI